MPKDHAEKYRDWLVGILPQHARLAAAVDRLLRNMLEHKRIEHLSVGSRVKTLEGALEKINRKEYSNPNVQLTDLTGVRVITYLEQQVDQMSAVIKESFEVDAKNSLDRTEILGDDKVGYRSTHFVCSLGPARASLMEYEGLGALKFEIQVRTVLQHAWAELAHDRSFKFGTALPRPIQRKLNLYSGLLEIVDSAFDEISREVDAYSHALERKSIEQISQLELNQLSIKKLIADTAKRHDFQVRPQAIDQDIIQELNQFGVSTIGDLEALFDADYLEMLKRTEDKEITTFGVIRLAMMYHDLEKYLSAPSAWNVLGSPAVEVLAEKYGNEKLKELLEKAGKEVIFASEKKKKGRTKR